MAQSTRTQLARSTVNCRCHVCAFFNSREDEYKVMLPFIKEGFDVGDRAVYILDNNQRSERMQRLADTGIDTAEAKASGQLEVRPWENAYLRPGRFDQYAMIDLLENVAKAAMQQGPGMTRLWANMEWALLDFPGVHDIVEYESRLNYFLPNYEMATVCTYDVTKFSASVVMDIIRTHPQVIVGGILRGNPFYVPPDEFLRELDARNAAMIKGRKA
ncbi:MAG TPA: MEDS domain-containing protein [Xanthobacteraceae bacterium]|nr:MEDS domain-containing protein [Xanthobacteraceae bacterium]